jgi:hypothetical protein
VVKNKDASVLKWKKTPLLLQVFSSVFLSACTTIPKSTMLESHFAQFGCSELDSELVMAQETRRVASGAKSDAWKIIFPSVIAVRYFNASSALTEVESRMVKLAVQQQSKGCIPAVG